MLIRSLEKNYKMPIFYLSPYMSEIAGETSLPATRTHTTHANWNDKHDLVCAAKFSSFFSSNHCLYIKGKI
jgi:hypothetical protein